MDFDLKRTESAAQISAVIHSFSVDYFSFIDINGIIRHICDLQLADDDKKCMMQFKAQTLSLFVMDVGLLASLGNPAMKAYGNITVYFINILITKLHSYK